MARAIWTGSISFGLLNVPVKLYSAVSSRAIRFRELREKRRLAGPPSARRRGGRRGGRLRGDRQGLRDRARPVRGDDARRARGARPEEDRRRSRSRTSSTSTRSTRSTSTSPTTSAPRPAPSAPTRCSPRRWREQRKVAIARFVMRNKESLAAIRADRGRVLTLATMRFADEVVPVDQLGDVLGERRRRAEEARGRDGQGADRVARQRLRPRVLQGRVPRRAARS